MIPVPIRGAIIRYSVGVNVMIIMPVWFSQEVEPEYNPGKTARDEERERQEQEKLLRQVTGA